MGEVKCMGEVFVLTPFRFGHLLKLELNLN